MLSQDSLIKKNQRAPHYLNYNEDFSCRSHEGSSHLHQEQIQQPSVEERIFASLNEEKKDHVAWEIRMKEKAMNEEAHVTELEKLIGQLAIAIEE